MTTFNQNATFMSDTFKQFGDTVATQVQAGVRLCEDASRFWVESFAKGNDQFRARFDKLVDDTLPSTRRNMERVHKLFEEQASKNLELVKQFGDSVRTPSPTDMFEKWNTFIKGSFDTFKSGAEMIARTNAEAFEAWTDMMPTGFATTAKPAPKAPVTK